MLLLFLLFFCAGISLVVVPKRSQHLLAREAGFPKNQQCSAFAFMLVFDYIQSTRCEWRNIGITYAFTLWFEFGFCRTIFTLCSIYALYFKLWGARAFQTLWYLVASTSISSRCLHVDLLSWLQQCSRVNNIDALFALHNARTWDYTDYLQLPIRKTLSFFSVESSTLNNSIEFSSLVYEKWDNNF